MGEMVAEVAEGRPVDFGPENPFYEASTLPFGAPQFDRIRDEHYQPALLAGMDQHAREIKEIAENPEAPTFANTVAALELTGALLDRVQAAFGAVAGANTNPTIEQIQQELAPKFAAHWDAINLNEQLFRRVEAIYERREHLELDAESVRLLELGYKGFIHAGAKLNEADKAKLRALNAEMATLGNDFNRMLLAANNAGAFITGDAGALAGLSEAQLAAAADAARARGVEGFAVPLKNTTQQPVLAELSVRSTRKAIFERSLTRTEQNDAHDTRSTIARLAQLRAEKARLLGFETYAAWKLDDQMAKTPATAKAFLDALAPRTKALADSELEEIQRLIDAQGGGFAVAPWDWNFYAEQVRRAKYDLEEQAIRPYFEATRVLEGGVFYAATQLYGISFVERYDIPAWVEDVRVFEVFNEDGSHLALFYCDLWKRDSKRGGAWMSSFVQQSRLRGTTPVIYNVCNFAKAAAGEPALISFDDVTTMFHEFGHALHGMFSDAVYAGLAGTSVPRDFVELPSQFNEYWSLEPHVFTNYARHYATGAEMPEELAAKLRGAKNFNQGYEKAELLAAALLDIEWHTLPPDAPLQDSDAFERGALERTGMAMEAIPPRYRSSYFAHIWGGGYSAGYYAYLWSEMLEDRAKEWFEQHGGLTRANGERFRKMVLSRGNTEDPGEMFERWIRQ